MDEKPFPVKLEISKLRLKALDLEMELLYKTYEIRELQNDMNVLAGSLLMLINSTETTQQKFADTLKKLSEYTHRHDFPEYHDVKYWDDDLKQAAQAIEEQRRELSDND